MKYLLFAFLILIGASSCESGSNNENKLTGAQLPLSESVGVKLSGVKDGETVSSPLKLKMIAKGLEENQDLHGNFFILINQSFVKQGNVIEADGKRIFEYDEGQTEVQLKLEPGKTVITIQFADDQNRSYGHQMSRSVKVFIEE